MAQQMNMMPNGMSGQAHVMNTMQRPQPGNQNQQIHGIIMTDLRKGLPEFNGSWQSTFDVAQRANRTMQLITGLRQIDPDVKKCLTTAQHFELHTIRASANKEQYMAQVNKKLKEIQDSRANQVSHQNMLPPPMNINPANLNVGMGGNGNMNMGGNANMTNGFPPNMAMPNMGFQQSQQHANETLNPQSLMAPPMQQQNSQNADQQQNLVQQTHNMNQQPQFQAPNLQQVQAIAQRWFQGMNEQKRAELRMETSRNMSDQQRQLIASQGGDPAMHYLLTKARNDLTKAARQQQQQALQIGANSAMGGDAAQQGHMGMQGGPNFDFSSIMAKQASALKLQESGEQVVPASNNANLPFATPQQMGAPNNGAINPAMLNASHGGPIGQPANREQALQMQRLQMEKKRQEAHRLQSAFAQQQQQAAFQQGMLQNQAGLATTNALTGPAGGSPAMAMLNKPVQLPGGQVPNTPQQQNQNQVPNVNQGMQGNQQHPSAKNVNALLQQHQTMLDRNNQGMPMQNGQNPNGFPRDVGELMATLNPAMRAKLASMSREQVNMFLRQYAAERYSQHQQMLNMQGIVANNAGGAQSAAGRNAVHGLINGTQPMGLSQQQQVPGQPQRPPDVSQAQLQARAMQQQRQLQQQQVQQHLQQQQSQQGSNAAQMQAQRNQRTQHAAMLVRPFPQEVLGPGALNLPSLPPNVNTWGALRHHLSQNAEVLPPSVMQNFNRYMQTWFSQKPDELQAGLVAVQAMRNNQMQQQNLAQQNMPAQGAGMPIPGQPGGAPTAQMLQPPQIQQGQRQQQLPAQGARTGQMPGQLNMPVMRPVTREEINIFRAKVAQAKEMSDEQVVNAIDRKKRESLAVRAQNLQTANMTNNAQMQNRVQKPNAGQVPGPPAQQHPTQHPQQQQQQQGGQVKRAIPQVPQSATSDDVMEIPNPNAAGPSPAKAGVKHQPHPFPAQLSTDQRENVKPEDQVEAMRRMQALRQANQGSFGGAQPSNGQPQQQHNTAAMNAPKGSTQAQTNNVNAMLSQTTDAELATVKRWLAECRRESLKGPPLKLSPAEVESARQLLRTIYKPFNQVNSTFTFALKFKQFSHDRIKDVIRAKFQVFYNWDEEADDIKGYLSLNMQQLVGIRNLLMNYLNEMKHMKAQAQAQAQVQAQAQCLTQAPAEPMQLQQAQIQQGQTQVQPPTATTASAKPSANQDAPSAQPVAKHSRKASSTNKAPAAPTEHKTFDWEMPANPRGVPKYDQSGNQLTPDKLKMPPSKRRKTGQGDSPASTPSAQVGTPASDGVKMNSPEQMRKMQQQMQAQAQFAAVADEQQQRRWMCEEAGCPDSISGFENEEMLKAHMDIVHAAIEDPMQFLFESAAGALGFDMDGNPLPPKKATEQQRTAAIPKPSGLGIRTGTPQPGSKPPAAAAMPAALSAVERPLTLRETMAMKTGFTVPPPTPPTVASAIPPADTDFWHDFSSTLAVHSSSHDGWIDPFDPTLTTSDDVWSLRLADLAEQTGLSSSPEPETTPSSGGSDVSVHDRLVMNFEWDAFGNGDVGIPEGLGEGLEGMGLGGDMGWSAGFENGGEWDELFGKGV